MTLVLNGSNDIIFFNSKSKDILITPQTRLKASQVGARPGALFQTQRATPTKTKTEATKVP
jgi:hypothetical protein